MNKYAYMKFEDVSGDMFEQLVAVTNKMTEHRQQTSRDAWYSILLRADMPLETKIAILASTAKGLDTDDLFKLQAAKPVTTGVGCYEAVLQSLLARHERAKERARQKRLNPPPKKPVPKRPVSESVYDLLLEDIEEPSTPEEPDFDADEYCWAR